MPLKEELRRQGDYLFKYRGVLPIIILIPALILTYLNNDIEEKYYHYFLFISLIGLLLRCITIGTVAENTSGRNTLEGQIADTVNTTGIYSIVRHPLYLGNFFMWMGLALCTQNIYFIFIFILAFWLYYERIMYAEEEFLREKFGIKYIEWASKTPAFVPNISTWKASNRGTNWKKIIKQEKSGLLLLCIVFYVFYSISINSFEYNNLFSFIVIAGIVFYILIKVLEKTTGIFKF
ncbi:MAG: hypothetical protein RLZZ546_2120 [Bacteroidota bacterium]